MNLPCVKSLEERQFSLLVYEKELEAEAEELKNEIHAMRRNSMRLVDTNPKSDYRNAHSPSRLVTLSKHKKWLDKSWPKYSNVFAEPKEVVPEAIQPRLELVTKQRQRDIFRIARLSWSLPYSLGYGRRLNYLIWDDSNQKLIGILGLQSPPITFSARDTRFNIPKDRKPEIVNQTMDAYSVGAIPPYSDLLAGKLAVLAAASKDVRQDYEQRYEGRVTEMEKRVLPAYLIAVTTLSAFGRSSLYNRVSKAKNGKQNLWATVSLGNCKGWGSFYFNDDLYHKIKLFHQKLFPDKPVRGFGTGPKVRQLVISHVLRQLRLPQTYLKHDIKREVFIISHTENLEEILAGKEEIPIYNDQPFQELAEYWKQRYCLPRANNRCSCSIDGKQTIAKALELF